MYIVAAQQSHNTIIAHPGQDVELVCDVTAGSSLLLASWRINGMGAYGVNALLNGILTGYSSNWNNLIIQNITMNDGRNGSEYQCVIGQNRGNVTFLYVNGEYIVAIYPD